MVSFGSEWAREHNIVHTWLGTELLLQSWPGKDNPSSLIDVLSSIIAISLRGRWVLGVFGTLGVGGLGLLGHWFIKCGKIGVLNRIDGEISTLAQKEGLCKFADTIKLTHQSKIYTLSKGS